MIIRFSCPELTAVLKEIVIELKKIAENTKPEPPVTGIEVVTGKETHHAMQAQQESPG